MSPFSHPAHRTGQADFPHPACMGLSLSRGRHAILVVLCIPFFCSTARRELLPSRPHISIAVARSGGQGRRFFSAAEGLSLTDASTAAGCRRSGDWPRDDPRGACHWPRSIARTTLVWGFLCQGCVTPFWSSFAFRFFCSTRAASILPSRPPYLHRRRAQRRSRTALLQRRRRLILDGCEH